MHPFRLIGTRRLVASVIGPLVLIVTALLAVSGSWISATDVEGGVRGNEGSQEVDLVGAEVDELYPANASIFSDLVWPVRGPILYGFSDNFAGSSVNETSDGIGISVPIGTLVRASGHGEIVYKGDEIDGYGNIVIISHQERVASIYGHLDLTFVKKGDFVRRGQAIGKTGVSGATNIPHLHFQLRQNLQPIDPLEWLSGSALNTDDPTQDLQAIDQVPVRYGSDSVFGATQAPVRYGTDPHPLNFPAPPMGGLQDALDDAKKCRLLGFSLRSPKSVGIDPRHREEIKGVLKCYPNIYRSTRSIKVEGDDIILLMDYGTKIYIDYWFIDRNLVETHSKISNLDVESLRELEVIKFRRGFVYDFKTRH